MHDGTCDVDIAGKLNFKRIPVAMPNRDPEDNYHEKKVKISECDKVWEVKEPYKL